MPHVFPQIMPRPQLRFAAASFEQCQILSCHDLRSDRGGESGWCNGSDFAANYRQLALWSAECAGDFGCGCCCHKYFWREDCGDSRIGRTCAGNSSGRFAWVAAFEKETRSQESSVFQKSEPVVVQGSQTAFEQGRWTTWFGFPKGNSAFRYSTLGTGTKGNQGHFDQDCVPGPPPLCEQTCFWPADTEVLGQRCECRLPFQWVLAARTNVFSVQIFQGQKCGSVW